MRMEHEAAREQVIARRDAKSDSRRKTATLWTCVVVLLAVWTVGVVTSTRLGGLVHLLLAAAVVLMGALWARREPI